jgi:hypothetical protein
MSLGKARLQRRILHVLLTLSLLGTAALTGKALQQSFTTVRLSSACAREACNSVGSGECGDGCDCSGNGPGSRCGAVAP